MSGNILKSVSPELGICCDDWVAANSDGFIVLSPSTLYKLGRYLGGNPELIIFGNEALCDVACCYV